MLKKKSEEAKREEEAHMALSSNASHFHFFQGAIGDEGEKSKGRKAFSFISIWGGIYQHDSPFLNITSLLIYIQI